MKERITLTLKEIKRLKAIELILRKQLSCKEAAQKLGISERHIYRLLRSYREEGEQGLAHGNRGRPSKRRLSESVRAEIKAALEGQYHDYNSRHLLEELKAHYQIELSYSTLQNLRREFGYRTPRRKKASPHRSRRDRKPLPGMMLQADASIHAWLEDRGPKLALHAFIDDATNYVWALFRTQEDSFGYIQVLRTICLSDGIPMSLYTDRRNIFEDNRQLSIEERLDGIEPSSHFKALLSTLGIDLIQARSPQAKGRVERLFGTLQDRLVKALRAANACTLPQANQVLEAFLPAYNADFTKNPAQSGSAFIPWNPQHAPDDFFCCHYTRSVRQDNTIAFDNSLLHIPPTPFRYNFARAKLNLRQLPSGNLKAFLKDQFLVEFVHDPAVEARIDRFVPAPVPPIILDFLPDILSPEMNMATLTT